MAREARVCLACASRANTSRPNPRLNGHKVSIHFCDWLNRTIKDVASLWRRRVYRMKRRNQSSLSLKKIKSFWRKRPNELSARTECKKCSKSIWSVGISTIHSWEHYFCTTVCVQQLYRGQQHILFLWATNAKLFFTKLGSLLPKRRVGVLCLFSKSLTFFPAFFCLRVETKNPPRFCFQCCWYILFCHHVQAKLVGGEEGAPSTTNRLSAESEICQTDEMNVFDMLLCVQTNWELGYVQVLFNGIFKITAQRNAWKMHEWNSFTKLLAGTPSWEGKKNGVLLCWDFEKFGAETLIDKCVHNTKHTCIGSLGADCLFLTRKYHRTEVTKISTQSEWGDTLAARRCGIDRHRCQSRCGPEPPAPRTPSRRRRAAPRRVHCEGRAEASAAPHALLMLFLPQKFQENWMVKQGIGKFWNLVLGSPKCTKVFFSQICCRKGEVEQWNFLQVISGDIFWIASWFHGGTHPQLKVFLQSWCLFRRKLWWEFLKTKSNGPFCWNCVVHSINKVWMKIQPQRWSKNVRAKTLVTIFRVNAITGSRDIEWNGRQTLQVKFASADAVQTVVTSCYLHRLNLSLDRHRQRDPRSDRRAARDLLWTGREGEMDRVAAQQWSLTGDRERHLRRLCRAVTDFQHLACSRAKRRYQEQQARGFVWEIEWPSLVSLKCCFLQMKTTKSWSLRFLETEAQPTDHCAINLFFFSNVKSCWNQKSLFSKHRLCVSFVAQQYLIQSVFSFSRSQRMEPQCSLPTPYVRNFAIRGSLELHKSVWLITRTHLVAPPGSTHLAFLRASGVFCSLANLRLFSAVLVLDKTPSCVQGSWSPYPNTS